MTIYRNADEIGVTTSDIVAIIGISAISIAWVVTSYINKDKNVNTTTPNGYSYQSCIA